MINDMIILYASWKGFWFLLSMIGVIILGYAIVKLAKNRRR